MNRPIKMLSGTLVLGAGLGLTGVAYAAPAATMNSCWGQITQEFTELGTGIIGQHSSANSSFTPTPGEDEPPLGRKGVANQSRFLEEIEVIENGEPSEGGNGEHAIANGEPLGIGQDCDGPPVP